MKILKFIIFEKKILFREKNDFIILLKKYKIYKIYYEKLVFSILFKKILWFNLKQISDNLLTTNFWIFIETIFLIFITNQFFGFIKSIFWNFFIKKKYSELFKIIIFWTFWENNLLFFSFYLIKTSSRHFFVLIIFCNFLEWILRLLCWNNFFGTFKIIFLVLEVIFWNFIKKIYGTFFIEIIF